MAAIPDDVSHITEGTNLNEDASAAGAAQAKKKDGFMPSNIFLEDDEFYKKWAGPMILGPFMIAVVALIVIVSGEIVLHTWEGICNFPLDTFVSAAVGMSYLFLLVYTWIFIGDTVRIEIPMLKIDRVVLVPFKSMKWLMAIYVVLGFTSFIVWCVGSSLLSMAKFCARTAPGLYSFTTFLIAMYWIGFFIVIGYTIKMTYGKNIWAIIKERFRPPTMDEMEEVIFRKKFAEYDKDKEGKISKDDVPPILQSLGVYVPDEEIPALIKTLDPKDTGFIEFDVMFAWFKKLNSLLGEHEQDADEVGINN